MDAHFVVDHKGTQKLSILSSWESMFYVYWVAVRVAQIQGLIVCWKQHSIVTSVGTGHSAFGSLQTDYWKNHSSCHLLWRLRRRLVWSLANQYLPMDSNSANHNTNWRPTKQVTQYDVASCCAMCRHKFEYRCFVGVLYDWVRPCTDAVLRTASWYDVAYCCYQAL